MYFIVIIRIDNVFHTINFDFVQFLLDIIIYIYVEIICTNKKIASEKFIDSQNLEFAK